jgi:hypothetical protein
MLMLLHWQGVQLAMADMLERAAYAKGTGCNRIQMQQIAHAQVDAQGVRH